MKKLIYAIVLVLLFASLSSADVDQKDGAPILNTTDMDGFTSNIGTVDGTNHACASAGASACVGNFGTNVGTSRYNATANYGFLMEVATTAGCLADTADELCASLDDYNTTSLEIILIAYESDGGSGEPGTRLAQETISTTASTMTVACETISSGFTWSNSTGWVGFIFESASSGYEANSSGGTKRRYINLGSFTAPVTWNAAGDTHDDAGRDIDVYFKSN